MNLGEPKQRPTGWYLRVRFPDGCRPRVLVAPPGASEARAVESVRHIEENWDDFVAMHERTHVVDAAPPCQTLQELGESWTTGALAKRYPDRVKTKKSSTEDAYRLARHVYPHIGPTPVDKVTVDACEDVLARLPDLAPASRRHVAQLMVRVMKLAAYPCRLIPASPLPSGFLPSKGAKKALAYLYPDEEARLLACVGVPLAWRVVYGVLAREGLRAGELDAMTWGDLDLDRGSVRLDENKTDDPRSWALQPDVAVSLAAWRGILAKRSPALVVPAARVVVGLRRTKGIDLEHGAVHFRDHLRLAGVTRAELFERSAARQPIRLHDLRATFVTVSLATGRTETWVTDRTGHTTTAQLAGYRRVARQHAELGLGRLVSMVDTVPELAAWATERATDGGGGGAMNTKPLVHEGGLEPPSLAALEPKAGRIGPNVRKAARIGLSLVADRAASGGLSARSQVAVGHNVGHVADAFASMVLLWDALEEHVADLAADGSAGGRS